MQPLDGVPTEPTVSCGAVSATELRRQAAELEASIPALHDAMGRAALASYGKPADPEIRQAADRAVVALGDATQRMEQLRAAAELAEQHEATAAEAKAEAERQAAKNKLIRRRDRLEELAWAEFATAEVDRDKLPDAELELDEIARQWNDAKIHVDVLHERIANAERHCQEYMDQAGALAAEISSFAVTASEVAAAIARRVAAEEAEITAAQLRFDADCAAELQRLQDEQLITVVEPFARYWQMTKGGWGAEVPTHATNGNGPITVKRRELDAWKAEQTRLAELAAERDHAGVERAAASNPAYQQYLADQADIARTRATAMADFGQDSLG